MKTAIATAAIALVLSGCVLKRPPETVGRGAAPLAVVADPVRDPQHPARNQQLLLDSHGSKLNALFFLAQGEGPHPTMLLLHGLPGNERNLDLAQAVRRAGWNVLTFTYRGAWGSEGDFSISNSIEDAAIALAFLRSPEAVKMYAIDPAHLVLAGHSMGGFVAALTAARDAPSTAGQGRSLPLAGLILIDAANCGAMGKGMQAAGEKGRAAFITALGDLGRALHGATPETVADELLSHGKDWDLVDFAPLMAPTPVLTVYATHGIAEDNRALVNALRGQAGAKVTATEIDSDHAFADSRIALAGEVVRWLQAAGPAR
jgi:uncharacterized protein